MISNDLEAHNNQLHESLSEQLKRAAQQGPTHTMPVSCGVVRAPSWHSIEPTLNTTEVKRSVSIPF
jgi:hypothetical protein